MKSFFFASVSLIFVSFAYAGSWSAEIFAGVAHSFSTQIEIRQQEMPALSFSSDYETKSFEGPLYYALRGGWWGAKNGWEIEWIHLKVFVTNAPAEVQRLSVSHGYNLLMINYGRQIHDFIIRAGAGFVVPHAETVIRGVASEQGYKVTGPCGQLAVGRRFYFNKNVFASVEGKFTIARAKISIAHGEASLPNLSLHGLFGIGFQFD